MSTQTKRKLDPADYQIADVDQIFSPGLVIFRELVEHNIQEMIRIAGSPDRLRPHCKTHKMPDIIRMLSAVGINKHKCATLAEAEMLCEAGANDILIAYQLVGPNIERYANLMDKFPEVKFASLVDHPAPLNALAERLKTSEKSSGVYMDVDSGMGRTGIPAGQSAIELYEMIHSMPNVEAQGLHWYDGHNRQSDLTERTVAVQTAWKPLEQLRDNLLLDGFAIPKILVAGTGSFPVLAEFGEPNLELTPGTTTLYDIDYYEDFADLDLKPAAGVLTRVVSCNFENQMTVDCGHKSISPDRPDGHRAHFPELPDAQEISHTEEHMVLRTDKAGNYSPGDHLIALPRHVCPTVALHQQAYVIKDGKMVEIWPVVARDRKLTI